LDLLSISPTPPQALSPICKNKKERGRRAYSEIKRNLRALILDPGIEARPLIRR
jgi:hypothetical protein